MKAAARVDERSMVTSKVGLAKNFGPKLSVSPNPYQAPSLENEVSLSAGTQAGPDGVTEGSSR